MRRPFFWFRSNRAFLMERIYLLPLQSVFAPMNSIHLAMPIGAYFAELNWSHTECSGSARSNANYGRML